MKTLILAVAIISTAILQKTFAQADSSEQLSHVVNHYLDLKNALTKDDPDSARIAAKWLFDAIDKVPADKLSSDEQKAWMQYSEKLSYDAEHIKGTDEIDHQREHFMSLSANMYKLLQAVKMDTVLYYQFCPMANKGKGAYWISEQEKIVNPYFGKKMLSCGSTKEIIKPKE